MQNYKLEILKIWQANNKKIQLPVQGFSMEPVIFKNDIIEVQLMQAAQIKIGDIFIYIKNQSIVVHRAVAKKEISGQLYLIEKGDNLLSYSLIKFADVFGRVDMIYRGNKKINLTIKREKYIGKIIGYSFCFLFFLKSRLIFFKKYIEKNKKIYYFATALWQKCLQSIIFLNNLRTKIR